MNPAKAYDWVLDRFDDLSDWNEQEQDIPLMAAGIVVILAIVMFFVLVVSPVLVHEYYTHYTPPR